PSWSSITSFAVINCAMGTREELVRERNGDPSSCPAKLTPKRCDSHTWGGGGNTALPPGSRRWCGFRNGRGETRRFDFAKKWHRTGFGLTDRVEGAAQGFAQALQVRGGAVEPDIAPLARTAARPLETHQLLPGAKPLEG